TKTPRVRRSRQRDPLRRAHKTAQKIDRRPPATAWPIGPALCVIAALAAAGFFYFLTWLPDSPLLDGDEAVYVLMADYFSPFSHLGPDVTGLVMRHSVFPPVYPLLMGLVGATSTHIAAVRAVTTSFLLAA